MVIEAILFDKDGTLFDFEAMWTKWTVEQINRLAAGDAAHGAKIAAAIGFDLAQADFLPGSVLIAGTPGQIATALKPFLPGQSTAQIIRDLDEAAAEVAPVELVPLDPLLRDLRGRGHKLAVVTNDTELPTHTSLRLAGIADWFDHVIASDSGHTPKPAADMLLATAAALDVSPAACVMVGDSAHDLNAGRAAGMQTIGVPTGRVGAAELSALADHVLPDVSHIPAWLDDRG